jgi:hypothetical protein
MGSRAPKATAISFLRGWPTSSFFKALSATTCSVGFVALRICASQDGLAIAGWYVDGQGISQLGRMAVGGVTRWKKDAGRMAIESFVNIDWSADRVSPTTVQIEYGRGERYH